MAGRFAPPTPMPQLAKPHPMSVVLFGKVPPRAVDKKKHPKLGKAMKKLDGLVDQISESLGQSSEVFELLLSEGKNAMVGRDGKLFIGVELLEERPDDDDFWVAVLGHEIGHQPWTWPSGNMAHLTRAQLNHLSREEEAKADAFAGRVLADLGANPDALCSFLLKAEKFEAGKLPANYYPAPMRAEIIRKAFVTRRAMTRRVALSFPEWTQRSRNLR
jgi:predicted Zn-dependent protease